MHIKTENMKKQKLLIVMITLVLFSFLGVLSQVIAQNATDSSRGATGQVVSAGTANNNAPGDTSAGATGTDAFTETEDDNKGNWGWIGLLGLLGLLGLRNRKVAQDPSFDRQNIIRP